MSTLVAVVADSDAEAREYVTMVGQLERSRVAAGEPASDRELVVITDPMQVSGRLFAAAVYLTANVRLYQAVSAALESSQLGA